MPDQSTFMVIVVNDLKIFPLIRRLQISMNVICTDRPINFDGIDKIFGHPDG